jgi:hypothetical protein
MICKFNSRTQILGVFSWNLLVSPAQPFQMISSSQGIVSYRTSGYETITSPPVILCIIPAGAAGVPSCLGVILEVIV